MVALPVSVGTWWYRSIRYSGDQVLLDTTQMYYYFFHKTPHMAIKRVLMILGASAEFHRRNNQDIVERPTDNTEVPQLMKSLPQLNEKNKERPLCFIYSIKARSLLHAHLSRLELPRTTLEEDRIAVVCYLESEKCIVLHLQLILNCYTSICRLKSAQHWSKRWLSAFPSSLCWPMLGDWVGCRPWSHWKAAWSSRLWLFKACGNAKAPWCNYRTLPTKTWNTFPANGIRYGFRHSKNRLIDIFNHFSVPGS